MSKQAIIKRIYRLTEADRKGFKRDIGWNNVQSLLNKLSYYGYNPMVIDTRYINNGEYVTGKEFDIVISDIKSDTTINGRVVCQFQDFIHDPYGLYDISLILY